MNFNKLPLYRVSVNPDDEETGMTCISFVDDPAVEIDFQCFDKQEKVMQFSVTDEMEHKITGCAIWCDKPIYRIGNSGFEYYVVFDRKSIQDIVEKYSKQNLWNKVDLQHDGEMIDGVTMIEYFIKDTEKGISPKGFENVADGSLFCTYKINDDTLWNEIMTSGELNGFSIEIYSDLELMDETVDDGRDDDFSEPDLEDWLAELLKALEEDDVEIVMEDEKKKFSVSKGDISDAISRNRIVELTVGNKSVLGQIYGIGSENGTDVVIFYIPDDLDPEMDAKGDWVIYDIDKIKKMEITDNPLVKWDTSNPKWKDIVKKEDDLPISKTAIGGMDNIQTAMSGNYVCMISYYDGENNDGRGYRQCFVSSYGQTVRGNECIRIYEYSGASHSGLEGGTGNWRFLLTRRITSFKVLKDMPPVTTRPSGYNGEAHRDGNNGSMYDVVYVANFPPQNPLTNVYNG